MLLQCHLPSLHRYQARSGEVSSVWMASPPLLQHTVSSWCFLLKVQGTNPRMWATSQRVQSHTQSRKASSPLAAISTHRAHSSSFLGLHYRILSMNPKKELVWGLPVGRPLAFSAQVFTCSGRTPFAQGLESDRRSFQEGFLRLDVQHVQVLDSTRQTGHIKHKRRLKML